MESRNREDLDSLQGNAEVFFRNHFEHDVYLTKDCAIETVELCYEQFLYVLCIQPGSWISNSFRPSLNDMWIPACDCDCMVSQDVMWRLNRDAANYIRCCPVELDVFVVTVERLNTTSLRTHRSVK